MSADQKEAGTGYRGVGRQVRVPGFVKRALVKCGFGHASTPEGWHFFSIDIDDAAFIAWKGGEMQMARWNRDRGLDHVTRRTAVLDEPGQ